MSGAVEAVAVTADLAVRVPRSSEGDLGAGVETVLVRMDAVRSVESVEVTGVGPRSNAIRAEATVRLVVSMDRPTPGRTAATLDEGFGVAVEEARIDGPAESGTGGRTDGTTSGR